MFNPFPGLRPFEPEEDHLFFGRERETDDLLGRLGSTRLLAIVGTSGSGKSSLVRSGLIPSLHSGFMVAAGSSWRIALFRPGEDPVGHLARALAAPDVLGAGGELAPAGATLIEATLRRGTLGLVQAVRQAHIPSHDNVLVVVDQFEELFRFRRSRQEDNAKNEAIAFVKLLLEATRQQEVPVFVVLTMRSDFLGDCMEYPGLPEAINAGQYLVPRMTRDELRAAITGPVAVGGGTIAPRLVLRVLNDVGDDPDQLPLLQHALMRTWDHWERQRQHAGAIDIVDYEAIGMLRDALSQHAEEAYSETPAGRSREIAEGIFKALTDTYSDQRGVRRPTSVADLAAICEATEGEVSEVIEIFRRPGRSFLMPPATLPLDAKTIVDLSHESFMRCWTRLIGWAQEERAAAAFYVRLAQAAAWYDEGTVGLWRNPELELALRWRRENAPTAAWADRYGGSFERTVAFLDASEQERQQVEAERERERKRKLRFAQWTAAALGTLLLVSLGLGYVARRENVRAEANLRLARDAVDETLAAAGRDPARAGADLPPMQEFRRELLERTRRFYTAFVKQRPRSLEVRSEMALVHLKLAEISRMLGRPDEAVEAYRQTIAEFERLAQDHPTEQRFRQELGKAHNWLGETLRPLANREAEALEAYDKALRLQEQLLQESPQDARYRQESARTRYNRGILRATISRPGEPGFDQAEADFREAMRALEPLVRASGTSDAQQELARVTNNLGTLLAQVPDRHAEVRALYERAIEIDERLVTREPRNREYRLELAKFNNNLADLLREEGDLQAAGRRNQRALELVSDLARPAPSLGIELADTHNVRGLILESQQSAAAEREYRQAIRLFELLSADPEVRLLPEFHERFSDLLLNLANSTQRGRDSAVPDDLVADAASAYLALAEQLAAAGFAPAARDAVETLAQLMPNLPARVRQRLAPRYEQLHARLTINADPRR